MDASVLLIGGEEFLKQWLERIQILMEGVAEVCSLRIDDAIGFASTDAIALMQTQQPSVVIYQANSGSGLEICRQIREQSSLAWMYCLVIDSRPRQSESSQELIALAEALEQGADALLTMTGELVLEENRLLKAQIQAGLRFYRRYRELRQSNDVLSAIALADPLTEVSNRRALEWELPRQIQNARNQSTDLSLIMLDVDFFKSVNDTYGHLVGDRVLKVLAARLRHHLRLNDTLFRYGGEEFVIVLSQTDAIIARQVARRLLRLIGDQPFNIDGFLAIPITISLGVSSLLTNDDERGINLLQRADQNLLRAKSTGRNRVFSD